MRGQLGLSLASTGVTHKFCIAPNTIIFAANPVIEAEFGLKNRILRWLLDVQSTDPATYLSIINSHLFWIWLESASQNTFISNGLTLSGSPLVTCFVAATGSVDGYRQLLISIAPQNSMASTGYEYSSVKNDVLQAGGTPMVAGNTSNITTGWTALVASDAARQLVPFASRIASRRSVVGGNVLTGACATVPELYMANPLAFKLFLSTENYTTSLTLAFASATAESAVFTDQQPFPPPTCDQKTLVTVFELNPGLRAKLSVPASASVTNNPQLLVFLTDIAMRLAVTTVSGGTATNVVTVIVSNPSGQILALTATPLEPTLNENYLIL